MRLIKPSSEYFTDRSKAVLLLWIVFVSYASCGMRCAVVSVPCNLVVTCWERADLLAVECVVFSSVFHISKCVMVHIRIKGDVGAVKLVKPSSKIFLPTVSRRYFFCG